MGRERRRRWLNDKILRDMAGSLTAPDMASLFQPPPFGGPIPAARPTVLQTAALPNNVPLWDLFRNIGERSRQQASHAAVAAPGFNPCLSTGWL